MYKVYGGPVKWKPPTVATFLIHVVVDVPDCVIFNEIGTDFKQKIKEGELEKMRGEYDRQGKRGERQIETQADDYLHFKEQIWVRKSIWNHYRHAMRWI